MAAQGEESTVVATVPGVVTFGNLSFVDGTAVRKGTGYSESCFEQFV